MSHLSGDQIDRYLARTLSPGDLLALHEHTRTCPICREVLSEAALARMPCTPAPLLAESVEAHLTEEEMVAFVARRMPQAQHAQAARHVAGCEVCLDSVEAMESVRDQAPHRPAVRYRIPWWSVSGALAAGLAVAAVVFYTSRHPLGTPGPAIVASLRDAGGTIALDSKGSLRGLDTASPEERSLVRETLERGALPAGPVLPAEAPGVLLGGGSAAAPFMPVGPLNQRVLSDRPEFTWQPYSGAERYQVLVTNENLDPLARSGMLHTTQWQPETALPRGVTLLWQVRAWHGGEMVSAPAPPAPPARFEIAGEQIAARIEQLRSSPQPSHLLVAILCAREGLREEAAKEMQALARENPDSKLVGSLQGSAGGR